MVTTKPKVKGPPPDMEVPPDIQLKRSSVAPDRIGIWCRSHIPVGKKFGPFMGNKVQVATDDMDPTYVWEIVDLDSKEFLFYIDATDESAGNWMRYINCARYFEEQNIVSEQEGVDIIYRAIKDIYPGEEILTWYEKAPLRKKKGRKARQPTTAGAPGAPKCKESVMSRSNSLDSIESSKEPVQPSTSQVPQDDAEAAKGGMHVSQRGRRRKVTKYWEMESNDEDVDSDEGTGKIRRKSPPEVEKPEPLCQSNEEDWEESNPQPALKSPTGVKMEVSNDTGEFYQFEMKSWHIVKSRTGRKIFKCDICSSVYRHSFSLKRHYIRNHINYRYVSPTDLINCCVTSKNAPDSNNQQAVPGDMIGKVTTNEAGKFSDPEKSSETPIECSNKEILIEKDENEDKQIDTSPAKHTGDEDGEAPLKPPINVQEEHDDTHQTRETSDEKPQPEAADSTNGTPGDERICLHKEQPSADSTEVTEDDTMLDQQPSTSVDTVDEVPSASKSNQELCDMDNKCSEDVQVGHEMNAIIPKLVEGSTLPTSPSGDDPTCDLIEESDSQPISPDVDGADVLRPKISKTSVEAESSTVTTRKCEASDVCCKSDADMLSSLDSIDESIETPGDMLTNLSADEEKQSVDNVPDENIPSSASDSVMGSDVFKTNDSKSSQVNTKVEKLGRDSEADVDESASPDVLKDVPNRSLSSAVESSICEEKALEEEASSTQQCENFGSTNEKDIQHSSQDKTVNSCDVPSGSSERQDIRRTDDLTRSVHSSMSSISDLDKMDVEQNSQQSSKPDIREFDCLLSDSSNDSDSTIINEEISIMQKSVFLKPSTPKFDDNNSESGSVSSDEPKKDNVNMEEEPKAEEDPENEVKETVDSKEKSTKIRPMITVSNQTDFPSATTGNAIHGLFRCNVCEQLFDTVALLKQHIVNHPEFPDGRKTLACEKCEMKFTHKQNLMRHQAVHTGTKSYPCTHCDKTFPTSIILRRHEKTHQGHRFSCPHCPSSFTQTGELKKHVRKHHPEVFHECGFCTRYFLKQRALMEHLQETHDGKTLEENTKEIEVRQEAFNFDLQMDKAESRRLAIAHGKKNTGPRYACTVCRKRFVDYMSMCRHRSLAHQRPVFVPPIRDENGEIVEDSTTATCISPFTHKIIDPDEEGRNVFFAGVANKISDNLQNFVAGKEEDLKKSTHHIKWRDPSLSQDIGSTESHQKSKATKVVPISIYNPQEYNFPQGFKFREPSSNFIRMVYSADGTVSARNKKPPACSQNSGQNDNQNIAGGKSALLQFLQSDIATSVSQCMTSTCILASAQMQSTNQMSVPSTFEEQKPYVTTAKDLPIRIPQFNSCKQCRCIFHNFKIYQTHMQQKHKVCIPDESNKDSSQEPPIVRPVPLPYGTSQLPLPTSNPRLNGDSVSVVVKSEPQWTIPPSLLSSQTGNSSSSFIPIQDEPLDLSKKSHFKGYQLERKSGDGKSQDTDCTSEATDNSTASTEVVVKPDPRVDVVKVNTYVCTACFVRYDSLGELRVHQAEDHPNVDCRFTQVTQEVMSSWQTKPNPLGILNLCATPLPPMSDNPKRTQKPTCTKCMKSFCRMKELHEHIGDCAEPYQPKRLFVYYYPGEKHKKFFVPGSKGHKIRVLNGGKYPGTPRKKKSTSQSSSHPGQEAPREQVNPDDIQSTGMSKNEKEIEEIAMDEDEFTGRKRRRRNYELFYNPHRHIRRREMAEIIDTLKCTGCMEPFATISLLERHIPMCREKHKIIDQNAPKQRCPTPEEEDEDEFDPKKHTCIYCLKQFIYFRMLRKHVFDVCSVRKDLVEKGEYIDEEWEKDVNAKAGVPTSTTGNHTLSRQSSVSSLTGMDSMDTNENSSDSRPVRGRGRRRRRGNGWYKKGNWYKRKETSTSEWEPYFVLDNTFMGMYNSVEDDVVSNASTGTVDYEDGSNDATLQIQSREGSQDSTVVADNADSAKQLDTLQQEKRALFEELTKPIGNGTARNDVDEMKSSVKMSDVNNKGKEKKTKSKKKTTVEDQKPKSKKKEGKVKKDTIKANKTPKSATACSDNLAKVKQKLAKKIMENKQQKVNRKLKESLTSPDKAKSGSPMRLLSGNKKISKQSPKKNVAVNGKGKRKERTANTGSKALKSKGVNPQGAKDASPSKAKKLLKASKLNSTKHTILLSNSSEGILKIPKVKKKFKKSFSEQKLHDIEATFESVLRTDASSDEEDNIKLSELKNINSPALVEKATTPPKNDPPTAGPKKRKKTLNDQGSSAAKLATSIKKQASGVSPDGTSPTKVKRKYVRKLKVASDVTSLAVGSAASLRGRGRGSVSVRGRGRGRGGLSGELHVRTLSAPEQDNVKGSGHKDGSPSSQKRGSDLSKRGHKRAISADTGVHGSECDVSPPKKAALLTNNPTDADTNSQIKAKKCKGGKITPNISVVSKELETTTPVI